jgi:hypothetical protein
VHLGCCCSSALIVSTIHSLPPRSVYNSDRTRGRSILQVCAKIPDRSLPTMGSIYKSNKQPGSVETLRLLAEGEAPVGLCPGWRRRVNSKPANGKLDPQHAWPASFVSRCGFSTAKLSAICRAAHQPAGALRGLRIGIGEPGSGGNWLARMMLSETGVTEANATVLELSSQETAAGLRERQRRRRFLRTRALVAASSKNC